MHAADAGEEGGVTHRPRPKLISLSPTLSLSLSHSLAADRTIDRRTRTSYVYVTGSCFYGLTFVPRVSTALLLGVHPLVTSCTHEFHEFREKEIRTDDLRGSVCNENLSTNLERSFRAILGQKATVRWFDASAVKSD